MWPAAEAAAEVAGRGRVGNPLRAQGVEKDLVVAAQFDVFQPRAVAQRVVGQVQHVIRLVIGQMDFQQVHAAVDGLDQAALAGQLVHHADAARRRCRGPCPRFHSGCSPPQTSAFR